MTDEMKENLETGRDQEQANNESPIGGLFGALGRAASIFGSSLDDAGKKLDEKLAGFGKKVEETVSDPEFVKKTENVKKSVANFAEKAEDGLAKGAVLAAEGADKVFKGLSGVLASFAEKVREAAEDDEEAPAEDGAADAEIVPNPTQEAAEAAADAVEKAEQAVDEMLEKSREFFSEEN